jgi:hypothetical protein
MVNAFSGQSRATQREATLYEVARLGRQKPQGPEILNVGEALKMLTTEDNLRI